MDESYQINWELIVFLNKKKKTLTITKDKTEKIMRQM